MRKNNILLLLLLVASVSFSQVRSSRLNSNENSLSSKNQFAVNKHEMQKSPVRAKVSISKANFVSTSFKSIGDAVKAMKTPAADSLEVWYAKPKGSMYEGFSRDFRSWTYFYLHSPAITVSDYIPHSNQAATYSWKLNGGGPINIDMETNGTAHFSPVITPEGFVSLLPRVVAKTSTDSAEYVIGMGSVEQYLLAGSVMRSKTTDSTEFNGKYEFSPLTLANLHENDPNGNLYGGFSESESFSPAYTNNDGACKGVMQIIPKLTSPLYVESMSVLAFEDGGEAMPAGAKLKAQFYYLNEDGSLGELIAESTTDKFVNTYDKQGAFVFKFTKEEDGFIVDAPITLGTDASIAVRITGFDSTWKFKFLFGGNSFGGSSYTLHGDSLKVSTFGYTNHPEIPIADLYIQFNGIFNCLAPYNGVSNLLTIPNEGGWGITGYNEEGPYNDVDLSSSFNVDSLGTNVWIQSLPDWIDGVDYNSTYFADYQAIVLYFHGKPLPTGVTGRSGEIVVASYGVSISIPVKQGDVTGVNTPATSKLKIVNMKNTFEITNAEKYSTVSLFSVTGALLNTYDTGNRSSFSIPCSGLKNGAYLLKFSGKGTEVVKILK